MKVTCLNFVLVKIPKNEYNKGGGSREGSGIFMSNIIVKKLKISVEEGRVATTLNTIKH